MSILRLPDRNQIVFGASGAMFSLSWWVFADGLLLTRDTLKDAWFGVPSLFNLCAFFVLLFCRRQDILDTEDYSAFDNNETFRQRVLVFSSLVVQATSFAMSIFLALELYQGHFGADIVIHNSLLSISALTIFLGKTDTNNYYI